MKKRIKFNDHPSYMAKSLYHDLDKHALYEVTHCDTLVHYTKYYIHPSNSQDIKQNPWTEI